MKINKNEKNISTEHKKWFLFAAAGAVSGFINGFLGAGGGIIIVLFLSFAMRKKRTDPRNYFITSLAVTLPISVLSAVNYFSANKLNIDEGRIFILPAVIGGLAGAAITGKVKSDTLTNVFAAVTIAAGINMLFR